MGADIDHGAADRLERLARPLASWLCLAGGCAIASGLVLVPAWLDLQDMQSHRDLLREQAVEAERRRHDYRHVERALHAADPYVLEHVAYHHLRMKPVGTQPLDLPVERFDGDLLGQFSGRASSRAGDVEPVTPPVGSWMIDGSDDHKRWLRGPRRIAAIVVSGYCVAMGLCLALPGRSVDAAERE